MTALEEDPRDQYERTQLAWRRTALSLVATGLLVAHLAARDTGSGALVATLSATTAVVAFVWLSSHGRAVGAAGLALVLGVLLLGVVILVGVATG